MYVFYFILFSDAMFYFIRTTRCVDYGIYI